MKESSKRILFIDEIKGLGILLIVIGHIAYIYGSFNDFASYFKISIFYVAAGYVTKINNKQISLLNKAKSIMIPYCFWSFIYIMKDIISGMDAQEILISVIECISGRGIQTLWFLPSLFLAYFMHILLVKRSIHRLISIIAIPIITIYLSVYHIVAMEAEVSISYYMYCFVITIIKGCVAYWFFEMSFTICDRFVETISNRIIPIISIMGGYCVITALGDPNIDFNMLSFGKYPFLFYIMGMFMSFFLIQLFKITERNNIFLKWCGKNSLFIMCTHLKFVLIPFSNFATKVYGRQQMININYIIYCCVSFILVITIEFILIYIWRFLKKKFDTMSIFRYI